MRKAIKITLIFIIMLSVLATAALIFGAVCLLQYRESRVNEELLIADRGSGKTEFYSYSFDDRGKRLGKAELIEGAELENGIKYKYISFNEIPQSLINAFIAIEDKRFYDHSGVDWLRTGRAAVNLVFGSSRFGGSTITQQLVKNLTGDDEISISRKVSEAFSAIDIEKRLDKSEILESYLNVINLSDGCRGVGAAAEHFFSKEPSDLTLSECATLAAVTNSPSYYNPRIHPENCQKRRDTVLLCMLEQGFISEKEYKAAVDQPISLSLKDDMKDKVSSWYIETVVSDVIDGLCEKYGVSRSFASLMLHRGGYKIYTAMDEDIQGILDEYFGDVYNFPIDGEGNTAQSSMIIIDPYTGDILGVAGAIGKKSGNRVQNYATDTKRPPASTIKPLSVYAPAIEKGLIDWATLIDDSPIKSLNGSPWPKNVDGKYIGKVNISHAVDHSLNTVAVKVLDMVGMEESMSFLRNKLHLLSIDEKKDLGHAALALGQPTKGVTLRDLTAAYSIFTEGIMKRPRSYYRVTDQNGVIILDNSNTDEAVISRECAAIMTKLLESVIENGTARGKVSLDERIAVAGKSGTSQNNCDRYFVGYTPELLGGVWFGYDYPKSLEAFGGNLSVLIWDDVMNRIYDETDYGKMLTFALPDTVQRLSFVTADRKGDEKLSDGWFSTKANKNE